MPLLEIPDETLAALREAFRLEADAFSDDCVFLRRCIEKEIAYSSALQRGIEAPGVDALSAFANGLEAAIDRNLTKMSDTTPAPSKADADDVLKRTVGEVPGGNVGQQGAGFTSELSEGEDFGVIIKGNTTGRAFDGHGDMSMDRSELAAGLASIDAMGQTADDILTDFHGDWAMRPASLGMMHSLDAAAIEALGMNVYGDGGWDDDVRRVSVAGTVSDVAGVVGHVSGDVGQLVSFSRRGSERSMDLAPCCCFHRR